MSVSLTIEIPQEVERFLTDLPWTVRIAAMDAGFPAFARPIVQRAKEVAPSSKRTGSRKRWGKNKTASFDPVLWARDDSGKHIGHKVIKTTHGLLMYIGAQFPRGNKLQFNASQGGRKEVYWGRVTGGIYKPPERRFIDRAFDERRNEAMNAFYVAIESKLKGLKIG